MDAHLLRQIAQELLGREVSAEAAGDSAGRLATLLAWVRGAEERRLAQTPPAEVFNPAHPAWRLPPAPSPAYATVRPTGRGSGYGGPADPAEEERGEERAGRDAVATPASRGGAGYPDQPRSGVPIDDSLAAMSARQLAAGIRRREFSPSEALDAALRRIESLDPQLNAFITVTADQARVEAREVERRLAAGEPVGPLAGVPVAVKDIIETAGVRTTCGSAILRDHVPATDATVVTRLREAGAVIVGKTNTHEFAFGPTNVNPHYGPCRNPHNPARVSGGSSGGSAVAVASGMAGLALGTDTGGSIRIPAAACGLVGLKPTYGRISKAGIFPLSWSLDHPGPLVRTVADAALALGVLAGPDPRDPTTATAAPAAGPSTATLDPATGLEGVRVGLPRGWAEKRIAPGVKAAFDGAVALLASAGARVTEVDFPPADVMMLANRLLILAEAAAYHLPNLREHAELIGADVRARLELGQYLLAADYLMGGRLRAELAAAVGQVMTDVDLIVTPAAPVVAPYIGQDHLVWPDGRETVPDALIRLPAPFNVTGQPALTLPCGWDQGMPVGLQIVGRVFEEGLVLRAGAALEAALA